MINIIYVPVLSLLINQGIGVIIRPVICVSYGDLSAQVSIMSCAFTMYRHFVMTIKIEYSVFCVAGGNICARVAKAPGRLGSGAVRQCGDPSGGLWLRLGQHAPPPRGPLPQMFLCRHRYEGEPTFSKTNFLSLYYYMQSQSITRPFPLTHRRAWCVTVRLQHYLPTSCIIIVTAVNGLSPPEAPNA
jgi:hypothetical protein